MSIINLKVFVLPELPENVAVVELWAHAEIRLEASDEVWGAVQGQAEEVDQGVPIEVRLTTYVSIHVLTSSPFFEKNFTGCGFKKIKRSAKHIWEMAQ